MHVRYWHHCHCCCEIQGILIITIYMCAGGKISSIGRTRVVREGGGGEAYIMDYGKAWFSYVYIMEDVLKTNKVCIDVIH